MGPGMGLRIMPGIMPEIGTRLGMGLSVGSLICQTFQNWSLGMVPGNGLWEWSLGMVPGNGAWDWFLGMVPGKGPWEWSLEIFPGNGPYPNSLIYHGSQKFRLDGGDKRFSCHNRMCHTSPTGNGPQFFWHCFKFAHSVDLTQSQTRRETERLYNQLSALQFVLLQSCDLISR